MKTVAFALVLVVFCSACSRHQQVEFTVAHRYALTGRVVSLNANEQTASIDAAAVPGYMEAMTMEYPIKSKAEFDRLRVGETIKATLNVNATNDEYDLTGIQDQGTGKK